MDIIEEEDFTGIVSFPDFKIPRNPKYIYLMLLERQHFSLTLSKLSYGTKLAEIK